MFGRTLLIVGLVALGLSAITPAASAEDTDDVSTIPPCIWYVATVGGFEVTVWPVTVGVDKIAEAEGRICLGPIKVAELA